ncbi:MAG: SEL1-like repeat protein [Magnetococcales bacterium]|nr:SEL1-like repeat protein [Magnetococcales bacterium]
MRILLLLCCYIMLIGLMPGTVQADELALLMERADTGEVTSQWQLGMRYLEGRGVKQDYQKAEEWLRRAAEQGLARAQYRLGRMYDRGEGVAVDAAGAAAWYRKAAEQNFVPAQNNLGNLYRDGKGVEQDHAAAVSWYRKAAEAGDASAQANLSAMYANGHGVEQDSEQAAQWLQKSAKQGYGKARLSMQTMPGATLTPRSNQQSSDKALQTNNKRVPTQSASVRKRRLPVATARRAPSPTKQYRPATVAPRLAQAPQATPHPAETTVATAVQGEAVPGEVVAASVPTTVADTPTPSVSATESAPPVAFHPAVTPDQPTLAPALGGFGAPPQTTPTTTAVVSSSVSEPSPPSTHAMPSVVPEQPPVLHFRMSESGSEPGVVRGGAVEQELSYPVYQAATVPTARYIDNGDGTITDRLRGLVGLKNANCFGRQMWESAQSAIRELASGQCQLRDNSRAGDWRLLSRDEMHILLDWQESGLFDGVIASGYYWSATPHDANPAHIWYLMPSKGMLYNGSQERKNASWPVRAIRQP